MDFYTFIIILVGILVVGFLVFAWLICNQDIDELKENKNKKKGN